jgi:hypothetical protein
VSTGFGRYLRLGAAWLVGLVLTVGCSSDKGDYDSPIPNEDVPVIDIAELPDIEQTAGRPGVAKFIDTPERQAERCVRPAGSQPVLWELGIDWRLWMVARDVGGSN